MNILREHLKGVTDTELFLLANSFGIPQTNRKHMIRQLEPVLLTEKNILNRLKLLPDPSLELVKQILRGTAQKPEKDFWHVWGPLFDTFYFDRDNDDKFIVEPRVKKILPLLDTSHFLNDREKFSWLDKCLDFASIYYGIFQLDNLVTLYNVHPKLHISQEEMMPLFLSYPADLNPAMLKGKTFVAREIEEEDDSEEYLEALMETQKPYTFYVPRYQEIEEAHTEYYITSHVSYGNMRRFLKETLHLNDEEIADEIDNMCQEFSINEPDLFIDKFEPKHLKNCDETVRQQFLRYVDDAFNHTRLLDYRGHTPLESKDPKYQISKNAH